MDVTVRYLLKLKEFKNFSLLAGSAGLDHAVTSATVMDTPDVHNWLKGGEILLTSGYIFQNDFTKLRQFMINISKVPVSALFIDVDLYIKKIPGELLALADELHLPVVYMPPDAVFRDIISTILLNIAEQQTRRLLLYVKMQRRFTDSILRGGSIQSIIDILSQLLEKPVGYKDAYFNEIYTSDKNLKQNLSRFSLSQLKEKYAVTANQNDDAIYQNRGNAPCFSYGDISPIP